MRDGPLKTSAIVASAVLIAAAGIALGRYAEADDAPGGVLFAAAMVVGAGVLGVSPWFRTKS